MSILWPSLRFKLKAIVRAVSLTSYSNNCPSLMVWGTEETPSATSKLFRTGRTETSFKELTRLNAAMRSRWHMTARTVFTRVADSFKTMLKAVLRSFKPVKDDYPKSGTTPLKHDIYRGGKGKKRSRYRYKF